ncbi:unnamed protein product [Sphagnum jensenii]|uniref:Uncharacterized protein n=1 Tax=Sphagnum jensenii TaxID=128206 RepID=A0ABP1AU22_9BRYO
MAALQSVSSHLQACLKARCQSGTSQEMVWHVQLSDYSSGILSNFPVENGRA